MQLLGVGLIWAVTFFAYGFGAKVWLMRGEAKRSTAAIDSVIDI